VVTPPDAHDDEHNPLTTKDGWRQFVDDAPVCPPMLSARAFNALAEEERLAYNEPRLDYHSRLVIVATPTVRNVFTTGRRLVLLNRHQISGRRGLIVTGQAGTGKTTAIAQLGRNHELLVRKRLGPAAAGRLPVVYVTVPPRATPKMLAIEFARFLGLPVVRQETQTSITNAVCDLLIKMRVELALVDEIHNLNIATQAGAEASDQLKYLSERIPATFVLPRPPPGTAAAGVLPAQQHHHRLESPLTRPSGHTLRAPNAPARTGPACACRLPQPARSRAANGTADQPTLPLLHSPPQPHRFRGHHPRACPRPPLPAA
jgi:hypothetical protein